MKEERGWVGFWVCPVYRDEMLGRRHTLSFTLSFLYLQWRSASTCRPTHQQSWKGRARTLLEFPFWQDRAHQSCLETGPCLCGLGKVRLL